MNDEKLNQKSTEQVEEPITDESYHRAKKLDALGWGLFLIWIGVAFLADFGVGIGLLGVGIITLGVQVARKSLNLKAEGFWVVVGILFVLGGLWELVDIKFGLVPFLLILAGLAMLVSAIRGRRAGKRCCK